jgi:hypothetical protein
MGGFERFCWAVTALASIAAAALLGTAFFGHSLGAPQETAFAAIGVAVIPYVFTRAIQAMGHGGRREATETYPSIAETERPEMPPPPVPGPSPEPEPSWAERSEAAAPETELPQPPAPRARRGRGLFRAQFPPTEPVGPKLVAEEPGAIEPAPIEPVVIAPAVPMSSRSEPLRAEPAFTLPSEEPARAPLVARDRLVEPPAPRPKREGMGRVFWILVGILVVLLAVAAVLVTGGL